jgi:hypothetical protein
MASERIDEFGPGPLGDYRGGLEVHDDGTIDRFKYTGSIIPGEEYVGSFKVKREIGSWRKSGGGGGGDDAGKDLLTLALIVGWPLLLVLGLTALFVCPGLWLLWRVFGKKSAPDPNARPKFVGAGWVILAMLMLLPCLGGVVGLLTGLTTVLNSNYRLGTALSSTFTTGGGYGSLIIGGICVSWVGSLFLGAIDILRKNRASTIIWVFVLLAGLEAFGWFVVFRNSPQTRLLRTAFSGTATSASGPEKAGAQTANVLQIGRVSRVAPRQTQTITIRGSGFGSRPAYTGDSDAIRVSDLTRNWNAGWANDPGGDEVTLSVASWTDTRIVIAGFGGAYGSEKNSVGAGDELSFQVWNAESGTGPAVYRVTAAPN